jgi:hypothetical protein
LHASKYVPDIRHSRVISVSQFGETREIGPNGPFGNPKGRRKKEEGRSQKEEGF